MELNDITGPKEDSLVQSPSPDPTLTEFSLKLAKLQVIKRRVFSAYDGLGLFFEEHKKCVNWAFIAVIVVLYHVFLVLAAIHDFSKAETLIILTCLVWLYILCSYVLIPRLGPTIYRVVLRPASSIAGRCWRDRRFRYGCYVLILLAMVIFLVLDTSEDRRRLIGLGGIILFLLGMWLLSTDRRMIAWRPVIWGFGVQFLLGIIVLRWPWGHRKFQQLSNLIVRFLDYTNNGTVFVYGFLAEPPNICGTSPVFFFTSLQVVIFFGSVVSLLYHFGIMQYVVKRLAWCLQKTLKTTATESLNACACVFLGQAEAPLLIQPYLEKMTASELHAVMTSGFSCIAGSLFSAYVAFGACPLYLMSSTVMSAPGSLACSKMLFPETEESQLKRIRDLELPKGKETTALECVSSGAVAAVSLVAAIAANLIVFLALLAFIDNIFDYAGELLGYSGWSFDGLLGYIFFPVAFVMGVTDSPDETLRVAQLMGTKTTLNEFIAYQKLGTMVSANPPLIGPRSAMIATYALCGFSNFSSIGIQLGVLGGMAPGKKQLLAKIVLRALMAGCISCFFTATVAGILVKNPTHCAVHASENCLDVELLQKALNNMTASA